MTCKNCGTEIKETEQVCSKCGTPVTMTNQITKSAKNIGISMTKDIPTGHPMFIYYAAAAMLQLLLLIFRFVSFISYSIEIEELSIGKYGSFSINELMGSSLETVIFILAMLSSIALCVLPILKKDLDKHRKMIFSWIAVCWNAITAVLSIISISDYVARSQRGVSQSFTSASWSLSFGGWLNILFTIATLVVLFLISKKTKNNRSNC